GIIADVIASWVGILGIAAGLVLYTSLKSLPAKIYRAFLPISILSNGKFFVDEIYGALVVRPLEDFAAFLWKFFDQGVVDGTVNGTAAVIDLSGEVARGVQTGQVRHYAFFMFLGTAVIIAVCFLL